jgi:ubiquinone/menaquinone biosynthesis C-methylase UbiE
MDEVIMEKNIIRRYEEICNLAELPNYYGHSDFLNFGYWHEDTTDHKQACENLMEELLSFIPKKSGTILDVACGKGATTAYLMKCYPARNITGINISQSQLEIARVNAPGCTFLKMSATDLEFADCSFDNVICVEAAFHFCTRERFLREAHRVLKPGGRLILSDILNTLEGEKTNETRTEQNYVPDLDKYRAILTKAGFGEVEVVDATESCWKGHFWYTVRYFHRKLLSGEIDRGELETHLFHTYRRAREITYYVLAEGTRT